MAVSEAPETSVSRKRMRFTVPPADTYSGSWGYCSEEETQEHSESDGGNEERQDEEDGQGQEESQRDQEPSESDGDDESLDEEEQVEQERQIDQELAESDGDEEGARDEEDEQVEQERQMDQESSESDCEDEEQDDDDQQVEQERQMDQESSESDGDDEEQDEEDEQVEQARQIDPESSESDGEDEEQDEVDEQVEQERQMDQESSESDGEDEEQNEVDEQVELERQTDQELSESDGENEEQNVEEELAEEESQSIQAPVEFAGSEEERHDEEDEQVEQEMQIDQARSESDGEDEEPYVEELLGEEESQNNQASEEPAGGDEEGQEEEDEQAEDVPDRGHIQKSSSEPVLAPPPSKHTALANITLDEDMLDCGVCFLPLKPPIFQCDVGHVVCSLCRKKLAAVGRCHVCSASITGGYRRCHALEQLLESICGSCPNATYGCAARVPYYDLHAHLRGCPHAPCHCPAEACGFVGSTAALLDHFVSTHKWPCITGVQNSEKRVTHLHDGFNFMAVIHEAREYLFLLRVVRSPFGRAISSLCLHPQAAADGSSPSPSKNVSCRLQLFYVRGVFKGSNMLSHLQNSSFKVACTDLTGGMPSLNDCFQFIVPYAVQPESEATVRVEVSFNIR